MEVKFGAKITIIVGMQVVAFFRNFGCGVKVEGNVKNWALNKRWTCWH